MGVSDLLLKFDRLRSQIKHKYSHSARKEHDVILAQLQQLLLQARTTKLKTIEAFEKDYFTTHSRLPDKDDRQSEYGTLLHEYRHVQRLLHSQKIDL